MDTVILDVVIGLLLAYLVLALLVTKLQETVMGQLFTSRQFTMHDMLDQALQGDAGLKQRLLANPIIASLFKGDTAKRGFMRAGGPSAIPSDLFARALLIEVFDNGRKEGKHPKDKYASPQLFVDNLPAGAGGIAGVLRGLLGDSTMTWTAYEAAIAHWFDQVGQRADGWFQRKAMRWGLLFSLAAAAALNVNTFLLAERLSGDPDLRRGVASLARRAVAEFGNEPGQAAAAPALVAENPIDTAQTAVAEVNRRVAALISNRTLAKFDPNQQQMQLNDGKVPTIRACARVPQSLANAPVTDTGLPISNPMTWAQLLPQLQTEVGTLRDATIAELYVRKSDTEPAAWPADAAGPGTRQQRLSEVRQCLNTLRSWLDHVAGRFPSLKTELEAANTSVVSAMRALAEVRFDNGGPILLAAPMFQRDPAAFIGCAKLPGVDASRLKTCLDSATSGRLSLPVGWTARNVRDALCRVREADLGQPIPQIDEECPLQDGPTRFAGDPRLGIPPMALEGARFWSWHTWLFLFGFVVTGFFVALGAPFWFDLLGRVVKMRAAGEKPASESERSGAGNLPAGANPADSPQGGLPVEALDGQGPFLDAKNFIERMLVAADKVALQTALGVPATGMLDETTRRALVVKAKALDVDLNGTDEVSLQAFLAIVGRLPAAVTDAATPVVARTPASPAAPESPAVVVAPVVPADRGGAEFPAQITRLSAPLSRLLKFDGSLASSRAQQRAMAVLYLVKQALQAAPSTPSLNELDALARARRLNQLQDWDSSARRPLESLAPDLVDAMAADAAIASAFARSLAPWLDWALGELGQFEEDEATVAASNPRIVEYLSVANGGTPLGDTNGWCGAFAAWVIAQHNGERPGSALPPPPAGALAAEAWKAWGTAVEAQSEARMGDIAVFYQDAQAKRKFHVTWVVRREADGRLLVIGGNQGHGCVSLAIRGGATDPLVALRRGG